MKQIGGEIARSREEQKKFRRAPSFVPAGQSTQLIVGASPDSDARILKLSENLYRAYVLKRVFYSAYMPVSDDPRLPGIAAPPLLREHRLYQADWLLRFYGFKAGELFDNEQENLEESFDPKTGWALAHLGIFPLEINQAPYEMLLRVPGIGVRSAQRIVASRRVHSLSLEEVKRLGVVMKRARYFITARGCFAGDSHYDQAHLRKLLTGEGKLPGSPRPASRQGYEQLSLFPAEPPGSSALALARTGEF
jgi:predicted DNA-binding helix-hairpin-helix protein